MTCLGRTVALNIQLISDTKKSTLVLSAEPCSYFILVFRANNNPHTSHRIEKPHLIDYSYLVFTHFLTLMTVILTGKQSSYAPSYQEIFGCHFASFHHCTRQAIKVNLGSATSMNALWQPNP